MSERRRLLLAIANQFKWLSYSYENLYYGLVPTTIDSKSVKNKAKVKKVYGNSVVENQLVNATDTSITLGTHKYLTYISGTWSLITGTNQTLSVNGGIDMVIDITQMFPFDTPTTLTDTRVQALLNRGYIPYNTGEIKSVDIGEISSESANLCDKTEFSIYSYSADYLKYNPNNAVQLRKGTYTITTNRGIYVQFYKSANTSDYLLLLDAISYYSSGSGTWSGRCLETLDSTTTLTITLTQDCIITICSKNTEVITNPMINVGSTALPYKPHQTFSPISFKYQGNGVGTSHDTLERTDTEWVFTKNMNVVDLGTCYWSKNPSNQFTTSISDMLSSGYSVVSNMLCTIYKSVSYGDLSTDNSIATFSSSNHVLFVNDTSKASLTAEDFKSAMSGVPLEYQLSTPQVIRIPRKHMLLVNLGEQNIYSENLSSGVNYYTDIISNAKSTSNCYCSKYLSNAISSGSIRNNIWVSNSKRINCTADGFSSVNEFKSAMMGVYVAIETNTEVEDMPFLLGIESGGTINANLFSWVKNQIVYDGNFANGTNEWYCLSTVYSQSVSGNVMTITKNANGAGLICSKSNSDITYTAGHKFVALAQVKPSRNCTLNFDVSTVQTGQSMTANVWNTLSYFANPSSLTNYYFAIAETTNTLQVNDTVQIKDVMLIDLTLAFGSGNEPTDVNDTRIQHIINEGYIPTDTTGNYENVPCEVLPNVDFEMKCK